MSFFSCTDTFIHNENTTIDQVQSKVKVYKQESSLFLPTHRAAHPLIRMVVIEIGKNGQRGLLLIKGNTI